MKKIFIYFILLLSAPMYVDAQTTWVVSNSPGFDADFSDLQTAVNAANPGDMLLIHGSAINYGAVTVNKYIRLCGPGYFLDLNPQTQTNKQEATLSSLTVGSGASGIYVKGLTFNGGISLDSVYNPIIESCRFAQQFWAGYSISANYSQNIEVRKCFINNELGIMGQGGSDFVITNSIILGSNLMQLSNSVLFNNNFHASWDIGQFDNCNFEGNIFVQNGTSFSSLTNSTFYNNLAADSLFANSNGNQNNVDMSTVFLNWYIYSGPYGVCNYDWWQLKPNSPASGAGGGGLDAGAFGGFNSYKPSGISFNPNIWEVVILDSVISDSIDVSIKAHTNNIGYEIAQLEYYWDNDPGFGNASQIPCVPSDSIHVIGSIVTSNLVPGSHMLYVRARDTLGLWSHIHSETVVTSSLAADFTFSGSSLQVAFSNTSTYSGGTPTFSWNFGNGNTYIGANPPAQACPQNVCLTAILNGDTSTICKTVFVSPNFTPTIAATQSGICVGGVAKLFTTVVGTTSPFTRQWQLSTDSTIFNNISGATGSIYNSPSLTTPGTYYYRLGITKPGQCAAFSNVVAVSVVPDPVVSVTGNTPICGSGKRTLTAVASGGAGTQTIRWQEKNAGGAWVNIFTGAVYTTPTLTASRDYRVQVTNTGSSCLTTLDLKVFVYPIPPVTTNTPSFTMCTGGFKVINASGVGNTGSSYSWYPATGLSATSGLSVTATPTVTTTYTVVGTQATTGCSASSTSVIVVVPDPVLTISAPGTTICSGTSIALSAAMAGGTGTFTYQWQTSTNGTSNWQNLSGATSTSYTTPALTATRYYRLYATCNGNGCSTPLYSNTLAINVVPQPALTLSGANQICTGGSSSLSVAQTGGTGNCSYAWQHSDDGGLSWLSATGANVSSFNTPVLTANRIYRVNGSCTGIGCAAATSNQLAITVNPKPTISVTGTTQVCSGNSTTLNAQIVSGGAGTCTPEWQENISGTWTTLSTGSSSLTSPVLTTTGKSYRVIYNCSASGCAATQNVSLTVLATPNVTTNTPTFSSCAGFAKNITASGVNAGGTYTWSPATGLNTTTGATVTATPISTTTYTVTGTNTTGCMATATAVFTISPDPSATISGPLSVPSGGTATLNSTVSGGMGTCTYQWQSSTNGTSWSNIPGATSASYTTAALTSPRHYRLIYSCTGSGCDAATSNVHLVSIGSSQPAAKTTSDGGILPQLSAQPNPTDGMLLLTIANTQAGAGITMRLLDIQGKLIQSKKQANTEGGVVEQWWDLNGLAQGVYLLEVDIEGSFTKAIKVVKE